MLCKHRCTASALSVAAISNKNTVVWSDLCAPQPVDHSSCVELLLPSLLICRTRCSSVFNVSACLCVHCYARRGWKNWPAAALSGRQTQRKLFVGRKLQTDGSGNIWLVDADSCWITETVHHTPLDTLTAVLSELGKLL